MDPKKLSQGERHVCNYSRIIFPGCCSHSIVMRETNKILR